MPILGGLFLVIYAFYTFRLVKISKLDSEDQPNTDALETGNQEDNSIEMRAGSQQTQLTVENADEHRAKKADAMDGKEASDSDNLSEKQPVSEQNLALESRGKVAAWILAQTESEGFSARPFGQKLAILLDFLPKLLTACLIPESYNLSNFEMAVFPLCNTFVHLYFRDNLFKSFSVPYLTAITLPVAVIVLVVLVIIIRISPTIFTLAGSLALLDLLINYIVDILRFVGIFTGVSMLFLCLSVMGIANSVVDLFVDVSLAKSGYQTMAISGVFAGQLFNYLFGVGLAGILSLSSKSTAHFSFLGEKGIPTHQLATLIFVIGSHFFILIIQLYWMQKQDFKISRNSGKVFLAV